MKKRFKCFRGQRYFLLPYSLLLLVFGVLQIVYRQSIILVWINKHYSTFADSFFEWATHLGDGLFCTLVGLCFLMWSYKKGIIILVTFSFSGLVAQLLKKAFAIPRPPVYFEKVLSYLHTVPSVELLSSYSFPSGHSTTAFALFTLLAIWTKPPILKALWLVPAVIAAYSRMYLLQHFLVDVYFGSILGFCSAYIFDYYLEKYWAKHPKNWHAKGLVVKN